MSDIIIGRMGDGWKSLYFVPRHIPGTNNVLYPSKIFNTKEELEQEMSNLMTDGYYMISKSHISESKFRKLNKENKIGYVMEDMIIENYDQKILIRNEKFMQNHKQYNTLR
jgi:hypothetical protein